MENKKLTAVEWFINKLGSVRIHVTEAEEAYIKDIIKQAKKLEKEQIIESCNAGLSGVPRSAQQYYQNTYGNKESN